MTNIKVRDLPDTSTLSEDNQIMVLTDDTNNTVKNITVSNFTREMVSTDADNAITIGTDGKFYTPILLTENANVSLSNLDATGEAKFANPDLSNLTATGLGKFVQRVGDTMSGVLGIVRNSPRIYLDNLEVTRGTTPSADKSSYYQFRDATGQDIGAIKHDRLSSGIVRTMLQSYNQDGSASSALTVGYRANGDIFTSAPACAFDNSILTTVAHDFVTSDDTGKYMKLGNGIMFQWGYKDDVKSSGSTVTLPQAFADAYYAIYLGQGSYRPDLGENLYWTDRTTTSFVLKADRSENRNTFWLAIGTY